MSLHVDKACECPLARVCVCMRVNVYVLAVQSDVKFCLAVRTVLVLSLIKNPPVCVYVCLPPSVRSSVCSLATHRSMQAPFATNIQKQKTFTNWQYQMSLVRLSIDVDHRDCVDATHIDVNTPNRPIAHRIQSIGKSHRMVRV